MQDGKQWSDPSACSASATLCTFVGFCAIPVACVRNSPLADHAAAFVACSMLQVPTANNVDLKPFCIKETGCTVRAPHTSWLTNALSVAGAAPSG